MPIKTMRRYHLTPVSTATIKKEKKRKTSIGKDVDGDIGTLRHHLWECERVQLL